jgi:hypothetical protein
MNRKIFFFLLVAIIYYACESDNPETDIDGVTNEISCMIDDKVFKAFPDYSFGPIPFKNAEIFLHENQKKESLLSFEASTNKTEDVNIRFSIPFDTLNPLQTFIINYDKYDGVELKSGSYYLDTLSQRQVIVTKFDKEKRIITGEFNFKAINRDSTNSIKITKGAFNCKYLK